ncbi:Type 1 glutamine amidotransferase-like domain-containing protein [bacterium SCSIO 12696]|nr:Type 1 glutamine amidotransferase-like domain-containing protein [bacterium SCSIO 12696]
MTQVKRRILGFSDSPSVFVPSWKPAHFFQLMLDTVAAENPKIYYIGAAKAEDPRRIMEFYSLAARFQCQPELFRLFDMKSDDPDSYFADADIIFIDGGVTRNLLALFNEWQVVPALQAAYQRGVLLAGASAGICLLFDWCITDSIKTRIQPMSCLGILSGSVCPHFDVRQDRRDIMHTLMVTNKSALPGLGLADKTAALFVDEVFERGFTLDPEAGIHRFLTSADKVEFPELQSL